MKRLAAAALAAAALQPAAWGLEVLKTDRSSLDVFGRVQMFGNAELVDDPVRNDLRIYLFLKQARLGFRGNLDDYKYETQFAFASEDILNSNVSLTALDLNFDIPVTFLGEDVWAKVGQFKVPFGRETITEDGNVPFGERSITHQAFQWNRDMGVAFYGMPGKLAWTAGVFQAGGRDVPERYLGEDLGIPLLVARLGYNDGVDADMFKVLPMDRAPSRTMKAAYLNALYTKDTLIGHSTVLNLKQTDRSLLINKNWNPYLGRTATLGNNNYDKGELYQVGADFAVRMPVGDTMAFSGEAQVDYGRFQNAFGKVGAYGARVQGTMSKGDFDAGLRAAVVAPELRFFAPAANAVSNPTKTITNEPWYELTPMATWHLKGPNAKFIADLPIWFNVPVFNELKQGANIVNAGSYVATEQPDQSSVLNTSPNFVNLQTVISARLLFQLAF